MGFFQVGAVKKQSCNPGRSLAARRAQARARLGSLV